MSVIIRNKGRMVELFRMLKSGEMKKFLLLPVLILVFPVLVDAQGELQTLKWLGAHKEVISETRSRSQLQCSPCTYPAGGTASPIYVGTIKEASEVAIIDLRSEVVPRELLEGIEYLDKLPISFTLNQQSGLARKQLETNYQVNTLRKNSTTGQVERLLSFRIQVISRNIPAALQKRAALRTTANSSVLSAGDWFKIGIPATGMYKIDRQALTKIGINPDAIDPRQLRIYGNGGGMLPAANAVHRWDDLVENAITVVGEADGRFDANDYILFFAEGPNEWKYNPVSNRYSHITNIYSDTNYYFITIAPGNAKRVLNQTTPPSANRSSSEYDLLVQYEKDEKNLLSSGSIWYGESFDLTTTRSFNFNLPNFITSQPVNLEVDLAGRSLGVSSNFIVSANGTTVFNLPVAATTSYYLDHYAKRANGVANLNISSSNVTLTVTYNKPNTFSIGFLDYIWLQGRGNLSLSGIGNQLYFSDKASVGVGNVTTFTVIGLDANGAIWDVSNPTNAVAMAMNGGTFVRETDTLKKFIAFNGSSFPAPIAAGKIPNQNLHGLPPTDMIIVSHPQFLAQAEDLAAHRRQKDGLTVAVVTPEQCYNEFSSGRQDVTAIRSLIKHLYDSAPAGKEPRYLLLFGDASYDFKYRTPGNTNYVPSFQSDFSLDPLSSYASDSYFGLLDDNEGTFQVNSAERMDIGIGRIPVITNQQAADVVAKIKRYDSPEGFGDWRNVVGFLADDEDNNQHLNDAEANVNYVESRYPQAIVRKYFFDAYRQESRPGGTRYPDLNRDLNARINSGMLILNYSGHGGVNGAAEERVLTIPEIQSWNNRNKLMLMVTATCEFARFDDPGFLSAGEWTLLNPNGGAIALLTTTRVTFTNYNADITRFMYNDNLFNKSSGAYPRLGDVMMRSANPLLGVINTRNFSLLGDPSMRLAYPEERSNVLKVNNVSVGATPDTIRALARVTISGNISDQNGLIDTTFNGVLYPTILDKFSNISTLVNDQGSRPYTFREFRNILFKGAASVTNGQWSFTFIVPRDIAYNFGYGRINLYAQAASRDAAGDFRNVIVGGTDTNFVQDDTGPLLRLYMNDRSFVNGGITNPEPIFYADVNDSSGINTVGSGIGRDITLVRNNDLSNPIILNDFYQASLDDYTSGQVRYPFDDLEPGNYKLQLKIWDAFNNASDGELDFIVSDNAGLSIANLLNYPNPFTTRTTFHFDHNRPGETLETLLQVYSVSGKLVKTIRQEIITNGFHSDQLVWDGLDDYGDRIGRGVYIYKLRIQTSRGERAIESQKLVILR